MRLGHLGLALRGTGAWVVGAAMTFLLGLVDLADGAGSVDGAARTFIGATAGPLDGDLGWLVLVPVGVLALAGLRAGRSTTDGLVGRLKTVVSRVRSGRHAGLKRAAVAGTVVAVGFAVTAAVVGALLGTAAGGALVAGLLLGLVVCVPVAIIAARR